MVGVSFLGEGLLYFVIFIVVFNRGSRARAFIYLQILCFCLFLMNFLKMIYVSPRPFMVDDKIIPYGCAHDLGNPSGHSIFATAFLLYLFLDVFHGVRDFKKVNKLIYALSLAFTIAAIFTIVISRLYTGNHTIN